MVGAVKLCEFSVAARIKQQFRGCAYEIMNFLFYQVNATGVWGTVNGAPDAACVMSLIAQEKHVGDISGIAVGVAICANF